MAKSCEIPLTRGYVAVVDDDDYPTLASFKWQAFPIGNTTYAHRHVYRLKRTTVLMHREIMRAPTGVEVDHLNGDGLDNRRSNLRFATRTDQSANSRRRRDNRVGFKGVSRKGYRWEARVKRDGVTYHLGVFDAAREAAVAYDEAAVRLFGEFARTNFPRTPWNRLCRSSSNGQNRSPRGDRDREGDSHA